MAYEQLNKRKLWKLAGVLSPIHPLSPGTPIHYLLETPRPSVH